MVSSNATVFRNNQTGRLVNLFLVTKRGVLGQHIEEEDIKTKEVKTVKQGVIASRVNADFQVDTNFYKPVSYQ